jgi:ubiquinone/menaquinone biosynthesis C-methylase UbiE
MSEHFVTVTEIAGQRISVEQLERTCHRYHWASKLAFGKDVLEVGCGAGQGLELLRRSAQTLTAGDYSPEVLMNAQATAASSVSLSVFSAESLPFDDGSFDMIMLFEAIYYVPSAKAFFLEATRVLRPNGQLLIVTCNKDLYDFNPSPFSTRYLGVAELSKELSSAGFKSEFYGYIDSTLVSSRQRILRPVKAMAAKLGIIPKTMRGKGWLKRIYFGDLVDMPQCIADIPFNYTPPIDILDDVPENNFKVIYCIATKLN